jgi:SAM-dependent methyltransferase
VDVGGGASRLVDRLLEDGYRHVTVADLSEAALERARGRLGARAASVTWLTEDARRLRLSERVDVWHDRAVFHFLTDEADRSSYLDAVMAALRVGGHAVVATFGLAGPEKCSGLPVSRYDAAGLAEVFGPDFELVTSLSREHLTPGGGRQDFTYTVLRRLR